MRTLLAVITASLAISINPVYAEDAPADAFTITTNAFLDTGALPVLYTCDGKDISPQLEWTHVPAKTQSFALLLTDPDAPKGTFYHWVVYNLPGNTTSLSEDDQKLPAGTLVGKNSFDKPRYNGPCPPKGSAHNYSLTLYALDGKLNLPAGASGKEVETALQKHIIGKAVVTTVYSRWLQ